MGCLATAHVIAWVLKGLWPTRGTRKKQTECIPRKWGSWDEPLVQYWGIWKTFLQNGGTDTSQPSTMRFQSQPSKTTSEFSVLYYKTTTNEYYLKLQVRNNNWKPIHCKTLQHLRECIQQRSRREMPVSKVSDSCIVEFLKIKYGWWWLMCFPFILFPLASLRLPRLVTQ